MIDCFYRNQSKLIGNYIYILYTFFYLVKIIQLVGLIPINMVINIKYNYVLISKNYMSTTEHQRYLHNPISIKVTKILSNQNMHLLKLNYSIDFMNLPMVSLVINLNQCLNIYNWLIFESKLF